jgi:uncharacterized protein (DUF58 family)
VTLTAPSLPSLSRTVAPSPLARAGAALRVVTPLAWGLMVVAVAALVAGRLLGWVELTVLATTIGLLLLVSLAFTVGRSVLDVGVDLRPVRVQAGQRAAAAVTVTNQSVRRTQALGMEVRVGDGVAELQVPPLGHGGSHEEVFILPTVRRAVIPVGPVTSVRSDPFGLLRRSQGWTGATPLFVHPRTLPLAELGSGFLRDLEGRATDAVSQADVAFNTLREYEPGDDRRFVHWLTSARVGTLMVRQFIDTRRSHVGVVVHGRTGAYSDPDEFETAVSVAGSLGLRVLRDEQELSVIASGARVPTVAANALLDGLAAIGQHDDAARLGHDVDLLLRHAGGFSLALLVTGARTSAAELRAAALRFPSDVRLLFLRVDHGGVTSAQPLASGVLLTLSSLDDLPQLLWRVAS